MSIKREELTGNDRSFWFDCFLVPGSSGCMRDWLKMSGAATSDLDRLEEKTRSFHLSEGQIRHVYPAPVLKALLPVSVATKLKTCVGKVFAY